jgi:hypothetical protein
VFIFVSLFRNQLWLRIVHSDYEKLHRTLGVRYTVPDLAIAFNSGVSDPAFVTGWEKTIAFLLSHNVPCVFTVSTPSIFI